MTTPLFFSQLFYLSMNLLHSFLFPLHTYLTPIVLGGSSAFLLIFSLIRIYPRDTYFYPRRAYYDNEEEEEKKKEEIEFPYGFLNTLQCSFYI